MSSFFRSHESQEEKFDEMINEPVHGLIIRLAIPTIISTLITSIYNMADTFFVSQINTSASAAVGIIYALSAIIQAFAFMIGMGSGNNIARLLGQKKNERAAYFASVAYFTELIVGTLLAVIGLANLESLVYLLGATDTIAPYAMDYARYILLAAPFMMCSLGMNNMMRFQGNSMFSMLGIASGGILNLILDPIFIYDFGLGLGISGAAIATGISQFISFLILTYLCNHIDSCISIRISNFRPSLKIYSAIVHNGLPSLTRQGIASVASIVMNLAAHPYGDAAIAAISIVNRITMFMNSAVVGFGQGFQPVCGYNYGAKKYRRVMDAYYFSIKVEFIVLGTLCFLGFIFASPIITLFRREDAEVIRIGAMALRMQVLTFYLMAQINMANMFTQTIGYGFRATIISLLRQGLYLIPMVTILSKAFGLMGLLAATPVSDILSSVTAFFITRAILKDFKKMAAEQDEAEVEPSTVNT